MADMKKFIALLYDELCTRSCRNVRDMATTVGLYRMLEFLNNQSEIPAETVIEIFQFLAMRAADYADVLSEHREAKYFLDGNSGQVRSMAVLLRNYGLRPKQIADLPCYFDSIEDYELALSVIWGEKPLGWWQFEEACISHHVCTKEMWDIALAMYKREVEKQPKGVL